MRSCWQTVESVERKLANCPREPGNQGILMVRVQSEEQKAAFPRIRPVLCYAMGRRVTPLVYVSERNYSLGLCYNILLWESFSTL